MTRALCIIGMILSFARCATETYDYTKEPDPRKQEFVLGVNDAIHINVWKNPELSVDVRVRPDGTVTMPLIGDLHAAGRTPSSLRAEITRKLSNYIRDESAIVSIAVTEVNSYQFTVSGNVERGGLMTAKSYVTAAEAIAMAGGLNRFANPHKLVLVRTDANGTRRIPLDYTRISSGLHPGEDLVLLAGDSLVAQ